MQMQQLEKLERLRLLGRKHIDINSLIGLDGIAHILGMQDGVKDVTVGLPVRAKWNLC